jgi:hypothetical protein
MDQSKINGSILRSAMQNGPGGVHLHGYVWAQIFITFQSYIKV